MMIVEKLTAVCVVWLVIGAGIPGCAQKKNHDAEKERNTVTITAFVPPQDSSFSRPEMTAWFACHRPLDSLSEIFTRTLANDSTLEHEQAMKQFASAQDTICARCGLAGGYAHYRWITEHLGTPRNSRLYDSFKATMPPAVTP
jgi:hypothetical protein